MKRTPLIVVIVISLICIISCGKEKEDTRDFHDFWWYAKVEGRTAYLKFNRNGVVHLEFDEASSPSLYDLYSNTGSYSLNGNEISFNLNSSSMVSISEGFHVITADEDISRVTYGNVISFVSATFQSEVPLTYLDCFRNELIVRYKTASVINGKLQNLKDKKEGWKEYETRFLATHSEPSDN